MTDAAFNPLAQLTSRVRWLVHGATAAVALAAVGASVVDARSLLGAGALLIGWSQLVGL